MWNRVAFLVALAIAIVLTPRVYSTAEALIVLFPIDNDAIVFVDLDPTPGASAVFFGAHVCVAWCAALIWSRKAPLALKILTLILLSELIAVYAMIVRFRAGGIEVPFY